MTRILSACTISLLIALAAGLAQTNSPNPPAVGTTKVAAVNVGLVFSKYERAIALQKELKDSVRGKSNVEIQQIVGSAQKELMMEMWKDIQTAVKTCARESGIKLVLSYGETIKSGDADSFDNIQRKMIAMDQGSLIPLFVEPEADLSQAVLDYLNKQYREKRAKGADAKDSK